jgi:hypothetical protein
MACRHVPPARLLVQPVLHPPAQHPAERFLQCLPVRLLLTRRQRSMRSSGESGNGACSLARARTSFHAACSSCVLVVATARATPSWPTW